MHQHDIPEGARYCIQCGAPVAATGRTERLEPMSLEDRALSGDGDFYVTPEELYQVQCNVFTHVLYTPEPIVTIFGRRVIVRD